MGEQHELFASTPQAGGVVDAPQQSAVAPDDLAIVTGEELEAGDYEEEVFEETESTGGRVWRLHT